MLVEPAAPDFGAQVLSRSGRTPFLSQEDREGGIQPDSTFWGSASPGSTTVRLLPAPSGGEQDRSGASRESCSRSRTELLLEESALLLARSGGFLRTAVLSLRRRVTNFLLDLAP